MGRVYPLREVERAPPCPHINRDPGTLRGRGCPGRGRCEDRRQLQKREKLETPESLRFMLVNMLGRYQGKAFNKGPEQAWKRAKNLESSWAEYEGLSPQVATSAIGEPEKPLVLKEADSGDSAPGDCTDEPKTPDNEACDDVVDLTKTWGILNGV